MSLSLRLLIPLRIIGLRALAELEYLPGMPQGWSPVSNNLGCTPVTPALGPWEVDTYIHASLYELAGGCFFLLFKIFNRTYVSGYVSAGAQRRPEEGMDTLKLELKVVQYMFLTAVPSFSSPLASTHRLYMESCSLG